MQTRFRVTSFPSGYQQSSDGTITAPKAVMVEAEAEAEQPPKRTIDTTAELVEEPTPSRPGLAKTKPALRVVRQAVGS